MTKHNTIRHDIKFSFFSVPHHALGFSVDLIGKVKKGATVRSKHWPGEEKYKNLKKVEITDRK